MKSSCINIDQFIAYINKTISPKDRVTVEKHLSHCDKCLEMVSLTSQLVKETIQFQSAQKAKACIEKVKETVKDFYEWAIDQIPPLWVEPAFQPALALVPVRSDNDHSSSQMQNIYIKRRMHHLSTEMFFEQSGTGLISIRIRATHHNEIAKQVFIYMEAQGKGRSARMLKSPYVSFDDIPFGLYCIYIEQNNEEKGAFCFEVNNNGIYGK